MSSERLRPLPNPEQLELYPEDVGLSLWAIKPSGTFSGGVSELPVVTVFRCGCGAKLLENSELERYPDEELEEGAASFHESWQSAAVVVGGLEEDELARDSIRPAEPVFPVGCPLFEAMSFAGDETTRCG